MARAERNERRICFANARRRYVAEHRGDCRVTPEPHRDIDSLRADGHCLSRGDSDPAGLRAASDCGQEQAAKELQSHAHRMWKAPTYY